ncbi:MAG: ABC transporter substrate-binding protein [Myxococcales bacterium]|nr:ABC transporter substrate-binding protein [Myxococcales bacterium]
MGWRRSFSSLGLLGLLALTAVGGAGCDKFGGKKKPAGDPAGSASAAPETGAIVVGHFASMTGSEATFGQSTDKGVRMALEERNAAGGVKGRKIEVKTLDTASKASEGGTVVTRLINNEKVVALLGEVSSSISIAGGQVAQKLGVPMVSPSSTNERVTKIGDMIFRVCFLDSFQGYVMAKFATDDLKVTKVAILYDQQQAYSKGLANDFKTAFVGMKGVITTEQAYSGGDPDVSAQLQTIKTSGAQAIYMPGYYTDVGNMIRQARKLGIKEPFLGGDGWDSEKLTEIGGADIEGSYYSNHYSFEETRPEVQDFVRKYREKHGQVPDGLAALGYDAARILFDAMDRAPSLGGKDLAAALAATKAFAGVTGLISIDVNRDAQKKAVVLQIKNGKPAYVTSIAPPDAAADAPKPLVSPEPAADPAAAPAAAPAPESTGAPTTRATPPPAPVKAAPAGGKTGTEMKASDDPDEGGQ